MLFMRIYKLLSEYFGISQSLCNFILPIKGNKDNDSKITKNSKKLQLFYFPINNLVKSIYF